MQRFFFHLRNGLGWVRDEEGAELRDLEAARARAIHGIRSILRDEIVTGRIDLRGRIDIADEGGRLLDSVRFDSAVELMPEGRRT